MKCKVLVATIRVFETSEERGNVDNHLFLSQFEDGEESLRDDLDADDIDFKYLSEILRRTIC